MTGVWWIIFFSANSIYFICSKIT